MSWQSRVPEVLDALVALWNATPELAGIVQDGPVPLESPDFAVLAVGHTSTDEGTAAEGIVTPEGLGPPPDREQATISNEIAVLNGANDIRAARLRAYDLLSAASQALVDDRRLGGLVMRAHVQDVSLVQLQTAEQGALVRLAFTVAVDAYTVK